MSHKPTLKSVSKTSIIAGMVLVCVLCFCSQIIYAQETESAEQQEEQLIKTKRRLPMINGHYFVPSVNIGETPFITTFFRNSTGAGQALGYEIPIYDASGELITTLNAKITYMLLALTYQQAVNDWLAFWINATGAGRVGTNAESILSQGISALGAFELGGRVRVWESDKMILSAAASIRKNNLIGVDIIGFAKNAIETGIIDTSYLFSKIYAKRWKAGLRYAFAPSDLWGIVAFIDYGSGESLAGEDKNDAIFDLGGLVSLDLSTRTIVPIGFALGYKHTSYPESSGDLVERLGLTSFKISYTGRREFSLGLEFSFSSAPIVESDKALKFGTAAFNIQYFF